MRGAEPSDGLGLATAFAPIRINCLAANSGVSLARALVGPLLILADEPTASLG